METFLKLLGQLSYALAMLGLVLAALMMVHVTLDVILSLFMAEPLPGTVDYVSYYYMVGLVFLPLAYVEIGNEHIQVDLIHGLVGPRLRTVFDMLGLALSAVFFGVLAWQSWFDALEKYQIGEQSIGLVAVTVWPGRFFLPVGMGLMVLVLVVKLIRRPFTDADMAPAGHNVHE